MVLIVDDEADTRGIVRAFLEEGEGVDFAEAEDGKDALSHLTGKEVLIISDLNMPRMRGIELLREIRARGLQTPFLLWSSALDTDTWREAEALHAHCFSKLTDNDAALEWARRVMHGETIH